MPPEILGTVQEQAHSPALHQCWCWTIPIALRHIVHILSCLRVVAGWCCQIYVGIQAVRGMPTGFLCLLVWSINAKKRSRPFSPLAPLALSVCLVTEWWWWMFSGGSRRKWRPKSTDSIKDDLSATRYKTHVALMFASFILVRCFIKDQLKLIVLNLGPFQILSFRSQIS